MDLSWLEPPAPPITAEAAEEVEAAEAVEAVEDVESSDREDEPGHAVGPSLASPPLEADDDVHFGVAARALGVSRKTVERMVKRGQLERGPSNAPATVSKRALVAALEQRRRDLTHLTRAAEIEQATSTSGPLSAESHGDPTSAVREMLVPLLAPLLDEFVAVRTRAAVLESQLESLKARADQQRTRDELLLALTTSGWWGRRRTRKAVLRHYIVGDDPPQAGSRGE